MLKLFTHQLVPQSHTWLILPFFLAGCTTVSTSTEQGFPLPADEMTTFIDSICSPDHKVTVYNYMRGDTLYMEYGKFIAYQTSNGISVEDGNNLAQRAGDEELAFMPVENIYQGVDNGKTIYLLLLESKYSSRRDNTLTLAVSIINDQLVPANVFRYESQDTCILEHGNIRTYRKINKSH